MVARRYNTYKFLYTSDNSRDVVRVQREYLDENNVPLTPITQTFLSRVLPNNTKWEPKKNSDLRHALSYIQTGADKYGEFKSYLPYSEVNLKKQHLIEISNNARVICLDYVGEVLDYAK